MEPRERKFDAAPAAPLHAQTACDLNRFEAFVFGCVLVFDGEFCLRWLIASARPTRKKWVSASLESKLMALECVDPLVTVGSETARLATRIRRSRLKLSGKERLRAC